ncbi:MAG: HlyD family efflux transporter periplasmic adaptor subunit [Planctomycetes bacterium]|nr:HlyD family efflux transporter periplasmic adaptor subunit [Planctomycetota bacterium]
MKPLARRTVWILVAAGAGFVIWRSLQPLPVLVDVATIARGDLRVTVDDDGRTRVRERYTISAPVRGRLLRVPLEPGDPVVAGQTVVAEFEPLPPELLDARALARARADVRRAEAASSAAEARVAQAEQQAGFARKELLRIRDLTQSGVDSGGNLDRAERDDEVASDALHEARFLARVAAHELEIARTALTGYEAQLAADDGSEPREPGPSGRIVLRSPVDGSVLRRFEESARALEAGAPILEVGDTSRLEIVADYLSQDAVRVRPGMAVLVTGFGGRTRDGGERTLHGRVRVVEPGGYTKVSALGVEEQRVDIVVDPAPAADGEDIALWRALGDGYHVELRIVVDEASGVVIVPTGALFRARGGDDAGQAVLVVGPDGVARSRGVRVGRVGELRAEVLDGLAAGERVVLYPSELVGDGTRVDAR